MELLVQLVIGLFFLLGAFLITRHVKYYLRTRSVRQASLAEVAQICGDDGVSILDVRSATEYAAGHIFGAISLPINELTKRVDEISKNRSIYVLGNDSEQSLQVVKFLMSKGCSPVFHVDQGMEYWQGALISDIIVK